ncbi:MAG TPA: WD40 repeat domain-containing protein [Gemmataceae bacterium]|nr:WD40 repeat domain-containing protein [Gemmataceae bacterium]
MTPSPDRRPFPLALVAVGLLCLVAAVIVWWFLPSEPRAVLPADSQILRLSPDGRVLLTREGGTGTLRDIATGKPIAELPVDINGWSHHEFWFSPDGRWLSGAGGGVLKVWEVPSGRERLAIPVGGPGRSHPKATFSTEGRWFAYAATSPDSTNRMTVWDLEEAREHFAVLADRCDYPTFAPDGRTLVFQTWEARPMLPPAGVIRLWDVETGQERPPLETEPGPLRMLAFSPDGRWLAAAQRTRYKWDGPHEVVAWELATGRRRGPWLVPSGARDVQFSADGALLLVATAEVRTGSPIAIVTVPALAAIAPAVTPAGEVRLIRSISSVSPDGRLLAKIPDGVEDPGDILEVAGQMERATIEPRRRDEFRAVRGFSPDGRWYALVAVPLPSEPGPDRPREAEEGELRVYDTATGRRRANVPMMTISEVWFTPDGGAMVLVAPGKAPAIWDMPPGKPWRRIGLWWAALAAGFLVLGAGPWWLTRRRTTAAATSPRP